METLRIANAYTVYPAIVFLVLSLSPTYLSSECIFGRLDYDRLAFMAGVELGRDTEH